MPLPSCYLQVEACPSPHLPLGHPHRCQNRSRFIKLLFLSFSSCPFVEFMCLSSPGLKVPADGSDESDVAVSICRSVHELAEPRPNHAVHSGLPC